MWKLAVPTGALVSAPLLITKVSAAESGDNAPAPTGPRKTIKPSELPIYGEPIPPELDYIPEPTTRYREAVSSFREGLWEATSSMHGGIENVKSGVQISKEYIYDTKKKIQEDTGVLERAGIITVAGLGGIVAGYKGGILRKALLASAAMTSAAAICYPNQAVDITKTGWKRVKVELDDIYEGAKGRIQNKSKTSGQKQVMEKQDEQTANQKDTKVMQEKDKSKPSDPPKKDHGQSKPEDKDMYTTRS